MPQMRPTFSESWYRVADLKARLRPSTQVSRQFYRGDRWYVVRDPAGNQFHRLSAPAWRFVGLLDGTRTVAECWELVGGQLADEAPTQPEVIQILSQLHSANLIEADVTPDAAVLLRRHKQMIKRQWQGRLMNILFPRIPLWDADQFLKRWMPVMRVFISPMGALLWLAFIGLAAAQLVPQWSKLRDAASTAIEPSNWLWLWATFVGIKAIHELGHGFICRRYGGEVHELGVMFLVLVPAPYVDASSAWAFPNKWHRIAVGAGGMIFELFVAAIMAFVWVNTNTASPWNHLAYNAMLVASVSTILFNANPLLRYDGYYMLADWLEIPNLRYRSTEYTMGLIKRHLFRVKSPHPLPPVVQRIWLFIYCIASSFYRTLVGIFIIFMVYERVPVLGVLMALGGVITWIAVPIVKTFKYLMIEPELHRKRTRAAAWVLSATAAAIILVGFIPMPLGLKTEGVVQPINEIKIGAQYGGFVSEIRVRDGDTLKKDQVILVCYDRELDAQIDSLKADARIYEAQLQMARASDHPRIDMYFGMLKSTQKQLAELQAKRESLTIKAPIAGTLVAPRIQDLKHKYIQQGEEIAAVAQMDQLRITAVIDQDDAAQVFDALRVAASNEKLNPEVRLAGINDGTLKWTQYLPVTLERTGPKASDPVRRPTYINELPTPALSQHAGGDIQTDPSDQSGRKLLRPMYAAWMILPNPDHYYEPGQRVTIRFPLANEPLYKRWERRLWQLIQARTKSKWI